MADTNIKFTSLPAAPRELALPDGAEARLEGYAKEVEEPRLLTSQRVHAANPFID